MKERKLIFIFFAYCFFSCNGTMLEVYRDENLPLAIKGKIVELNKIKGGGMELKLSMESGKVKSIGMSQEVLKMAKKNDNFEKLANSNQCMITRGDSIIYFDCYNIPSDIRDSIGKIKEYPKSVKNNWLKR